MDKYHIKGGRKLSGKVEISGAKNAVLPILAASIISKGENNFQSCPEISDVGNMLRILKSLGCDTTLSEEVISVKADNLSEYAIQDELMKEMRSSVFLAGALLARCGEAVISNPGGCKIGKRPIDIHIRGLKQLSVDVKYRDDRIFLYGKNMKGAHIRLDYPSVGATENLMLAAVGAEGTTVIENSAREPEIFDLQNYINACGGCVSGAGSSTVVIEGGKKLKGCCYRIIPDRIEAGTYMLMAVATGGEVFLEGINRDYLGVLIDILKDAGAVFKFESDGIYVKADCIKNINRYIKTEPFPGFPTDLQPQMVAMLTKYGAGSKVSENIFENRFGYARQLIKMGADIEMFGKQVIIKSSTALCGGTVEAEDLRGGAALMIAGLMADGITKIMNTGYIKRGYSRPEEKIRLLGGEIKEYA